MLSFIDLVIQSVRWEFLLVIIMLQPVFGLIWRIVFPKIVKYPWPKPSQQTKETVVLAGSFNPPHLGHYAMLQYLSTRHETVICVVGMNPNKTYEVTPHQRGELLKKMLPDTIEVQVVQGYIWRYAKTRNCSIFYRGMRTWEKDGKEEQALQILNTWGPLTLGPTWPIPTTFLEGQPEYNHISSTLIRNLCSSRDDKKVQSELSKLVPAAIVNDVIQLYKPTIHDRE